MREVSRTGRVRSPPPPKAIVFLVVTKPATKKEYLARVVARIKVLGIELQVFNCVATARNNLTHATVVLLHSRVRYAGNWVPELLGVGKTVLLLTDTVLKEPSASTWSGWSKVTAPTFAKEIARIALA